jgi:hypothetical protein
VIRLVRRVPKEPVTSVTFIEHFVLALFHYRVEALAIP